MLGVYAGNAKIQLGGEGGILVDIACGDALLIPAGVGHKQIEASEDFMCVGAYPNGKEPDKFLDKPDMLETVRQNVSRVEKPTTDPVLGGREGIHEFW